MGKIDTRNAKQDTDIAVLVTQVKDIQDRVKAIEKNHLPHIENRLNKIERKLAYWAGGIVVLMTIAQIIINKIL